jgi:hypothetical protein
MVKKFIFIPLVAVTFLSSSVLSFGLSSSTLSFTTPIVIDTSVLNDSTNFSFKMLESSSALLSLSQSLLTNSSTVNTEYVEAMLQLSEDIGSMADRIGEMADKILIMADNIGTMSDRILDTQRIQSQNASLTQSNILKAQINFNKILKTPNI